MKVYFDINPDVTRNMSDIEIDVFMKCDNRHLENKAFQKFAEENK
jgi:hypothetical protein